MINENISDKLKSAVVTQIGNLGLRGTTEGNIASSEMINSIPNITSTMAPELKETKKKKKTPVIKRSIKKGNAEELVGNFPLNKPIGKMMSFKKSESNEATGAASSGQFSQPLFSEPKEKNKKVETKEATGSSSAGQYSTPKVWAKSMNKKDFRGYSKPQIKGGQFVQVKKKCKKFPYCNQGDINALNIFENQTLKKVIENVAKKYNIKEYVVKNLIVQELGLIK